MALRFMKGVRNWIREHETILLTVATLSYLIIGMEFYHIVEGWKYLDSIYFSVTTLTTVGYGDFSPKTDMGKLFTIGYILLGVGLILGFVDVVAQHVHRSPLRAHVNGAQNDNDNV